MSRVPPHDPRAEIDALSGAMTHEDARRTLLDSLTAADFYVADHSVMFSAIERLHADGQAVTPQTVAMAGHLDRKRVMDVYHEGSFSQGMRVYCARIASTALCRRAITQAGELAEVAYAHEPDAVLRMAEAIPRSLAVDQLADVPTPVTVDEFLAQRSATHDWLVPGFLERRDRLILTGSEGLGKSTLLVQWGVMVACGIQPWNRVPVAPRRVLLVDLENSPGQLRRALGPLVSAAGDRMRGDLLRIVDRGQGIDLRSPGDARWLDTVVGKSRAEVVVFGPLYKSFRGSESQSKSSEEAAEEVTQRLDALRVKHDVALLIEAHAPHGESGDRSNFRPRGSTLWLGWPEFGLGLKKIANSANPDEPDAQLVRWRGARDGTRWWPRNFSRGDVWPWENEAPPALLSE